MTPTNPNAILFIDVCSRLPIHKNRAIRHKRSLLSARFAIAHSLASLCALALIGCGGGGSDKSSIPADNTAAFLVSSVPAPTYTGEALLTLCSLMIGLPIVTLFLGETTSMEFLLLPTICFLSGVICFLLALLCFLAESLLATRVLRFGRPR